MEDLMAGKAMELLEKDEVCWERQREAKYRGDGMELSLFLCDAKLISLSTSLLFQEKYPPFPPALLLGKKNSGSMK